jgi:ribosomal protein S18 acetylase RimI-like enzyme
MKLEFVKLSKHSFVTLVKDDITYARLLVLTRNIGGGMRDLLKDAKAKSRSMGRQAILARIGNKIVGWGLINTKNNNSFNVFVANNYRRCGIGTLIVKAAKHIAKEKTGRKKLIVFPQDDAGWAFYEKNKVKVKF